MSFRSFIEDAGTPRYPIAVVGDGEPGPLAGLLEGTRPRLRGYPLAHTGKSLLILVSRYIEQRGCTAGSGTLHSGFQRLLRLDDEIGTREVYAELAATDVHLYGVDDIDAPAADNGGTVDLDATVHAGPDEPYREAGLSPTSLTTAPAPSATLRQRHSSASRPSRAPGRLPDDGPGARDGDRGGHRSGTVGNGRTAIARGENCGRRP